MTAATRSFGLSRTGNNRGIPRHPVSHPAHEEAIAQPPVPFPVSPRGWDEPRLTGTESSRAQHDAQMFGSTGGEDTLLRQDKTVLPDNARVFVHS